VLYGRDDERAQIGALLEAARASRSGALAIRGDPGIGKTALLEDTRERAADMHLLTARGVESESELPFAALHQLFRPALGHVDRLPEPQAEALRGALGLDASTGQERFLVFAACLSLLSELAERRPVLCLVDDAQWLDTASADALRFVVRRLDAEGVLILFGVRDGDESTFDAADVPSMRLEGLDADAAETLLTQAVGEVRERLLEQTRGNALALLEIPSVLTKEQLAGREPLPDSLPLTRQVESVFLQRVRRLPPDAQRLLLIAATDDSENAAVVARATAAGEAGAVALNLAEQAGLITAHGSRLIFRHPLVRSAVYAAATSNERRAAHRALAEELSTGDADQLDRRAWHLAAAALEPDATVVAALDEAAGRAESRAAFRVAVRAFERAAELSADDASRGRRLVDAARCASVAGADEQAVSLAHRAEPLVGEPLGRAQLARLLGVAEIRRGTPGDAIHPMLKAAREIAAVDPRFALELLLDAAWGATEGGDPATQEQIGDLALSIAPAVSDDTSTFAVNLLAGLSAIARRDQATAAEKLGWVVATAADANEARHALWGGSASLWLGQDEKAGQLFAHGAALARASGAFGVLAPALTYLGLQHFIAQRFDQAALSATEAEQFAREIGADNLLPMAHFVLAGVAAVRGDDDEVNRRAGAALELATAHNLPLSAARPILPLALLDIARGRWADALARLESLSQARLGLAAALAMRTMPDRIEAAVRAERPDAAASALATFEAWAGHVQTGWVKPSLAWARAIVAEGDAATAQFEEALRLGADARPFDLARIQLLYGEHLRRERRRSDARVQLRAALEAFDRHGAQPWSERARAELRASGETARRRDPSTVAQLTPQEVQIARLVAEGLSNKEVAAQLFLSPRTIDSHLRNIFSKLAISSRTQLARMPLGDDAVPATA